MAQQEEDREDLLAEARTLVERVSMRIAGYDDNVLVGFRRDHGASFYLHPQRVYQFTSDGHLRRAFVDGLLFKAENGELVALRRQRKCDAIELVRHIAGRAEANAFLAEVRAHLEKLHDALAKGSFAVVGQVPDHVDLLGRVHCWLDEFSGRMRLARSPRAC